VVGEPRGADRGRPSDRRFLRVSLTAGAIYDLALGLFIVFLGPRMLVALGHPAPQPLFHFYLSGLPLFVLPALYLTAARVPGVDAFRLPVLWARGGGGALIILLALLFPPDAAWIYFSVGGLDLVWAAVHAGLWYRDS